jgi:amino acid adenylation domain-containing protein
MLVRAQLAPSEFGLGYDVVQVCVTFEEALSPYAVATAFTFVANQHAALSARFVPGSEQDMQQELGAIVAVPCEVVDLRQLTDPLRAAARLEFLCDDRARGFDPAVAPLMRVSIVSLGEQRCELVWTVHHLLVDGPAIASVLSHAMRRYRRPHALNKHNGEEEQSAWSSYLARGEHHDRTEGRAFFRELVSGISEPTPLPCLRRPSGQSVRGAHTRLERPLDFPVWTTAVQHARECGVSPSTVVELVWALVLARYSNRSDVVFGAVRSLRAQRAQPELGHVVANLISTLPRRVSLDETRALRDLLHEHQKQIRRTANYEHITLQEIASESEIVEGQPLFNSIVVYEPIAMHDALNAQDPDIFGSASVEMHERPSVPVTFVVVGGERPALRLLFDADRLDSDVARELLAAAGRIMAEFAKDLSQRVGAVDGLSPVDHDRMVYAWNETSGPFASNTLIHEVFEQRAQQLPNRHAVEEGGRFVTYRQLDREANRLARTLRGRIETGDLVGVAIQRSIEFVVAVLAVAKAGATYVPLDVNQPIERSRAIARAAGVKLVIAERSLTSDFECGTLPVSLRNGARTDDDSDADEVPLERQIASDAHAYVIFTSGSTGAPKGVCVSHRAVVNTLEWVNTKFEVSHTDRCLFVSSPSFDLSVYDVFGVLSAGATIVIPEERTADAPDRLLELLIDRRVTLWNSAPAAMQQVVAVCRESEPASHDLRLVLLSGDVLPTTLPPTLQRLFPNASVINLGGATEAAIWSNFHRVTPEDSARTSIPYGRPIRNAQYHVLDHRMRPVPERVVGKLFIGGDCLASGYLHQPALTAERFVPNPFRVGERLYDTGDLARYERDGTLEFVGRNDHLVKVRGFRVELGEIEQVITSIEGVRQCVCLAHPDDSGTQSIVGFYVSEDARRIPSTTLRSRLRGLLPLYMVPARLVQLDAFPLTNNGKIDRQMLAARPISPDSTHGEAASNDLEQALLAVWRDVLGSSSIGVTDSFFDLGGHSLLAVRLVAEIRRRLGTVVPLAYVLDFSTVREMALKLTASPLPDVEDVTSVRTLRAGGRGTPLVFVTGLGGHAFLFRTLVPVFATNRPLYALQAIGAEVGSELKPMSVVEMARLHYVDLLKVIGTRQKVILAGYSFGALVAFELVKLFERDGRVVELFVSLDGFAPGYPRPYPWLKAKLDHLRTLFRRDSDRRNAYLLARYRYLSARARAYLGRPLPQSPELLTGEDEFDRHLVLLRSMLRSAKGGYAPSHQASCPILLIRSRTPQMWVGWDVSDPYYGWQRYLRGSVSVRPVPGAHHELFDGENPVRIARAVEQRLGETVG